MKIFSHSIDGRTKVIHPDYVAAHPSYYKFDLFDNYVSIPDIVISSLIGVLLVIFLILGFIIYKKYRSRATSR